MITILIAKDENKVKEMLSQVLRQEGYSLPAEHHWQNDIVRIMGKDQLHDAGAISLEDKIIEIEDALYKEKEGVLYKAILEIIEKPIIEHILERTDGNQLKAAKILGINRNTIRAKIKRLGIDASRWKNQ